MTIKILAHLIFFMTLFGSAVAQVKWDIKAGINYSNISAKDQDGNKANTSSVPGIYLGMGVALPLSSQFSVHPSLIYAKRGFKQHGPASHLVWGEDFEGKVSYFELPVDLLYSQKIGPGNLLLAVGPYLGYGTGGSWTSKGTVLIGDILIEGSGDVAFQNDYSYGRDMNTIVYARPWDYGAHCKIGYSLFNHYTISLDIQRGLANLQPRWADYRPGGTLRNRSMGVSIGYSF
ncbi:porin family protein [Anditalea andensis]|uniref:Outer membrane protein beta-barrel domain-containing protein n=1 Tax=Anditalea andensis TaxID=1048983 RepID=A0A074LNZ4_9BACT|nr:porin family protein [Anditalea andensis]KEO75607.1 hypothetical protein EL17_00505 [Anditalea andensis]